MTNQRDTVVVKDGGSNSGVILGIIVLIVVLAGAWYLLIGPGAGAAPSEIDVNVSLPSLIPAGTSPRSLVWRAARSVRQTPIPGVEVVRWAPGVPNPP
jgi:hypothetical protein